MNLQPVTAPVLTTQGGPCATPSIGTTRCLRPAYAFARADAGAYRRALLGNLSFPAALKIWVENIYVRNLTFRYTPEGSPWAWRRASRPYTSPPPAAPWVKNDWGAGYMRAVLTTLGIPEFRSIRAEGIDIQGWDVQGIPSPGGVGGPRGGEQRWARPWRQPLDAEKNFRFPSPQKHPQA